MPPNIVLLILDTARGTNFHCYGYQRDTTPNIDAIAGEGVIYGNAIAPSPWTLPSHASLFTGTFPSKHGAHENHKYLENYLTTIPQLLKSYGYQTIAFSNNRWISPEFGFHRGFDQFVRIWQFFQSDTDLSLIGRTSETTPEKIIKSFKLIRKGNPFKSIVNWFYGKYFWRRYDCGARRTNREIKKWLVNNRLRHDTPFFMFVNYMELHLKYRPPGAYRTRFLPNGITADEASRVNQNAWKYLAGALEMEDSHFEILRSLYDGELAYLDFRVGELYKLLKHHRLLDNTLLIITSDHGENIGEHGLMDHQYCLYDTLLKVPLIIRYPPVIPAGKRVEIQVQLTDVFPTIMDLLQIDDSQVWDELQGESILPERLKNKQRRYAIAEYLGPQPSIEALKRHIPNANDRIYKYDRSLRTIRDNRYKYIHTSDGKHELYDLENDPGEKQNLLSQSPDLAEVYRNELQNWLNTFQINEQNETPNIDPRIIKRLEELGYL